MLDPANQVPLTELEMTPAEQQARQKAMLQDLESLQSEKERAEDRLLDRLEAAATARRDNLQREAQARTVVRVRPLPRGPVRHPARRSR